MPRLTPQVDIVGRFELNVPWVANNGKIYTCKAVRSFQDVINQGDDPYKLAYAPVGATEAMMAEDKAASAAIITLIADDGEVIYVPDTYILSYPNMGDHHYRHVVLSLSLKAIPDGLALDHLLVRIAEVTAEAIGVVVEVKTHQAVTRDAVSPEEHERLSAARAALRKNLPTSAAQLVKLTNEYNDLAERHAALEKYVLDHGIVVQA